MPPQLAADSGSDAFFRRLQLEELPVQSAMLLLRQCATPRMNYALRCTPPECIAEQAAQWGMIWRVIDDEQLMPEANKLCMHLASQPTHALALMKKALNASLDHNLDQQLEVERNLQRSAGQSEDFREGVAAFLEKRPARFKGK